LSNIANSSNIAYFYLQNELKIPAEDMWKITNEAGSILGMTAKTLRHKVELMRRTMDLSDDDIRTMMKRHPSILHLSADKNLAPTILFLQRALDLSREDLRALTVPFPSILCYSLANLKAKINLFTKLLGFSIDECRSLFVGQPKLLTASVTTGLLPRVQFMLQEMQMPLADFRTLIKKNPLILLYSLEHNLRPKLIYFLIMTLHMEPRTVSKLLLKYPPILDYNLNNHILPISRYLVVELEFAPIEVRQILLKFPRLITWSIFKIKHVVGYLRYELGMDAAQVKRILYQAPQVIGLSETNLKNKVQYLRETFAFKEEELRKVVAGMPTLILCSTDTNLHPKIEFLSGVLGDRELRGAILLQPSLLGYSLDKRIRPRMKAILDIGAHPRAITVGISMKDDAFRLWLNGRRARLVQDPGYDLVNKKNGEIDPGPKETPKMKPVDRTGRIVHWTRSDE
jgi:mTERF domain-containing protein